MMKRPAQGLTLVELLITMAILLIILGVLSTFFTSQLNFSQLTKSRAETQDKARYLMALATQDLQLAGSSKFIQDGATSQTVTTIAAFGSCAVTKCLTSTVSSGTSTTSTSRDTLAVRYITSLRPLADACRSVQYSYSTTTPQTLQRSDVTCGSAAAPQEVATGVLAMNILYLCSNGTSEADPNSCIAATPPSFTRAARVTIYVQSDRTVRGSTSSYSVEGTTITCPTGRVCFGMQQEVVMPNLKDK